MFNLTTTADSGRPASFTSSTPSVATVSGGTVTIVGGGPTIITALQSGNATYNAAIAVTQILTVNKSSQIITFAALADKNVGDANFTLTATASSSLAISYSSSNASVATVSGNTVTVIGEGTAIITASQSGNSSYNAAMPASQTLTVTAGSKTDQTISFATLADKTFGDASFDLTATASSGLSVSYVSSNPAVATISGSTVTITGVGTTMITASQSGNITFNAAVAVSRTLTVNKKDQTISFSEIADKTVGDAGFSLAAEASSGLAVTYSATSDKVAITGTLVNLVRPGRATIIASQGGSSLYNQATSVGQSFCVKPAKPTITVTNADTESPLLVSSASEGNQWFLNDVAIPGATNASMEATQPGVYKVQVTIDDCVSDFSANQPLIVTGVIENHDDNMKVEVYPNPVSDWLHVSLGKFPGKKVVTIFQVNGIERASQEVEGDGADFEVTDYSSGMYVIKVVSGNNVRQLRFIKD